jgi:hypothetical protein
MFSHLERFAAAWTKTPFPLRQQPQMILRSGTTNTSGASYSAGRTVDPSAQQRILERRYGKDFPHWNEWGVSNAPAL